MILAIEGADCAGKTTLFEALREKYPDLGVYVEQPASDPQLRAFLPQVERREDWLWRQLYDPKRLYICDRFFAVSAPVYAYVFERPLLADCDWWRSKLRIVLIDTDDRLLVERYRARGDEHVSRTKMLTAARRYREISVDSILDGGQPTELLVEILRREVYNRPLWT